jgi:hypothetical protein
MTEETAEIARTLPSLWDKPKTHVLGGKDFGEWWSILCEPSHRVKAHETISVEEVTNRVTCKKCLRKWKEMQ